jgi:very-short-patch-repair endonuclease
LINLFSLKEFAATHRKKPTIAETVLWGYLSNKQLEGIKFRRQHIIDRFIADFISLEHKLIIEIDGLYHQLPEIKISDKERTEALNHLGFDVIRFSNDEVLNEAEKVKEKIKAHISTRAGKVPLLGGFRGAIPAGRELQII